jgi:glucose-6-phosphate-specific signal transduction histidine kinase
MPPVTRFRGQGTARAGGVLVRADHGGIRAEAPTNAAKHARSSAISVEVEIAGEVLRVTVRDDGVGGADFTRGTGLAGLKDRVEAIGGRISLDSPRGAGTSLHVELPITVTNGGITISDVG